MLSYFNNHTQINQLTGTLLSCNEVNITGTSGSFLSFVAASVFRQSDRNMICILSEKEEAAYFYSCLESICDKNTVLFFPSSYRKKFHPDELHTANVVIRTGTLEKICSAVTKLLIVTYPEALSEKIISREDYLSNSFALNKGDKLPLSFVEEILITYEFRRVDFVYGPGQYSIRGNIIDVFTYAEKYPYRVDFDGDEVKNIRSFNIENQLSIELVDRFVIIPDFTVKGNVQESHFLFSLFSDNQIVIAKDTGLWGECLSRFYGEGAELTGNFGAMLAGMDKLPRIYTGIPLEEKSRRAVNFRTTPQPSFNKNFDLLGEDILLHNENGYKIFIVSDNAQQLERLNSVFTDLGIRDLYETAVTDIHEGFIDNDIKLCCYTEHQVFGKYHKYKLRDDFLKSESITITEFQSLYPGDYIVHIDHGIGVFAGLEKVNNNGRWQEQIRLVFKDKDILYINLHSLHKLSKYKSREGEAPRLNKLGTGAWNRLKNQAKSKVKDIAKDLIMLYAERMKKKGFAFSADTYMQNELEASFIFEDTPDQEKACRVIKQDMEKPVPMDRLICGDVGFGKTELAIRAAFKAVTDSKQVAVLAPTTILGLQHYYTFSDRLRGFPCTVEFLSRLKTAGEQKKITGRINEGKIDIIIGTHKLLNKEIIFKDLGLLVIDEEQKFGVAAKEKLRKLKTEVDTLTLTATPIPRTLQFSLMGARDLSVLYTPPANRQPIITEVHTFDEELIRNAVLYEINRNGQVFFVHNRVQNINEISRLLEKLCPTVSSAICHGQMKPAEMENIMLDFISGKYDVLISTTIIENGLDIENVNTIIINNGHQFGLSDLHQLRGRVGRSSRKAFCYIFAPPLSGLPADTKRRLRAIEEFSELGSGFNIALQDLDIRGAGNLLGGEQSGFIADIGFDAYQKILQEAVAELYEEEFKTDESEVKMLNVYDIKGILKDCHIETDFELYIPESYVDNISERIKIYRELDNIESEEQISGFSASIRDRFGEIPGEVAGLFDILRLRRKAKTLGMERLVLKNGKLACYFISDKNSAYYNSDIFTNILNFIQYSRRKPELRENNNRLSLHFDLVGSTNAANMLVDEIMTFNTNN